MDDFIILSDSKTHLWRIRASIEKYLTDKLRLTVNRKTAIFPSAMGIDFLGYKIWPTHRLLRKNSIKRMRKKLKFFRWQAEQGKLNREYAEASINSWLAHAGHADSCTLTNKIGEIVCGHITGHLTTDDPAG